MAHSIKTDKNFTALGGDGALDLISFDGFYFLGFQGAQYDATAPADIYKSQSAASVPSAEGSADQILQIGNDWAQPADDMGLLHAGRFGSSKSPFCRQPRDKRGLFARFGIVAIAGHEPVVR